MSSAAVVSSSPSASSSSSSAAPSSSSLTVDLFTQSDSGVIHRVKKWTLQRKQLTLKLKDIRAQLKGKGDLQISPGAQQSTSIYAQDTRELSGHTFVKLTSEEKLQEYLQQYDYINIRLIQSTANQNWIIGYDEPEGGHTCG